MTASSTKLLSLAEVRSQAKSVLVSAGMDEAGSDVIADIVTCSERDGPRSHGLRMLPVYAQSFSSGYANGAAAPKIERIAPGVLRGDGDNGYYQIAAAAAREELIALARTNGIAAFTCANCHHLGGLRFDTEPLAEAGLVALAVINSLSMVVPQGGVRPVFGTNPMSFACPRGGGDPVVWDQAASMVALMDIRMAAAEGHELPRPAGLDPEGNPSTDPNAILETRSLLPFDNQERESFGALNIKGGATLIAIDPSRFGNAAFGEYITRICAEIEGNGTARVPGDGRLKKRAAAEADGVVVSTELLAQLNQLAGA